MGTRKGGLRRRIEDLEAFVRSLKIEDAKKRHLESSEKISDEEWHSLRYALNYFVEVNKEDPWEADKLVRSGLAATERLWTKGRLGWRAYCETAGQAAMVDYFDATDGEVCSAGTPILQRDPEILFESAKPRKRRSKLSKLARAGLTRGLEKKAPSENDTPGPET